MGPNRISSGRPAGGQFASTQRGETDITLAVTDAVHDVVGGDLKGSIKDRVTERFGDAVIDGVSDALNLGDCADLIVREGAKAVLKVGGGGHLHRVPAVANDLADSWRSLRPKKALKTMKPAIDENDRYLANFPGNATMEYRGDDREDYFEGMSGVLELRSGSDDELRSIGIEPGKNPCLDPDSGWSEPQWRGFVRGMRIAADDKSGINYGWAQTKSGGNTREFARLVYKQWEDQSPEVTRRVASRGDGTIDTGDLRVRKTTLNDE